MNKLLAALFMLGTVGLVSISSDASAGQRYYCKARGQNVCKVDVTTNQCVQTFRNSDYDNPMFVCQKSIGLNVSGNIDPDNYYCRNFGSRVCAVNEATGQCTHTWRRGEYADPMFSCEKFLGHGPSKVDFSNYKCSKTPSSVCARNLSTGQCTHHFTKRNYDNPMAACKRFLNQ